MFRNHIIKLDQTKTEYASTFRRQTWSAWVLKLFKKHRFSLSGTRERRFTCCLCERWSEQSHSPIELGEGNSKTAAPEMFEIVSDTNIGFGSALKDGPVKLSKGANKELPTSLHRAGR